MIRQKIMYAAATLAVCGMSVLLLLYEPVVSSAVRETLALFFHRVLPPLFPYMVLARLLAAENLLAPLGRRMGLARFLRLPDSAASVLLTGLLCGFPVGAAGTCTLYENGKIGRRDAGRLAALSSNAGPAFLLGTAAALWNSRAYGIFLLAVQTLSAFGIATAAARLLPTDTADGGAEPVRRCGTFPEELCRAVSDSASACLSVCAYIVFFRIPAVLFAQFFPAAAPFFSVLFEFASGCADGAALGGRTGIFLTGFAAGAAGLSVMMQNYNLLGRCGIPVGVLALTKGLQGLLCGGASVLFYSAVSPVPDASAAVFADCFSWNGGIPALSVLLLLSKFHKILKRCI